MNMVDRHMARHEIKNVRALILGLAREGTALARFLAEQGACVTVTDVKPVDALAERVSALADLPIRYALGGHPETLLEQTDIVFVSPGVPLEIPFLAEARRRGVPLSSETRLFTRLCPALVVGVTGSSGKSTTTALAGELIDGAGRRTWVGGNIGRPLIGDLDKIAPYDAVVMELSSFQLEFFGPWPYTGQEGTLERGGALFDPTGWSPPVAAVLNITPNHLDRHATMEAYVAAKNHILAYQQPADLAILNLDDPQTRAMGSRASGAGQRVLWFSLEHEVEEGTLLRDSQLILRLAGDEQIFCQEADLRLLGRHNLANALAACALAVGVSIALQGETSAVQLPLDHWRRVLTSFEGVEHRLELVRELDGVRWYNDSIATSPKRTVAALRAFESPIVLLAGGRDKHLPWDEMAALALRQVQHLILFGEAAGLIERAVQDARQEAGAGPSTTTVHHAGTLQKAVELASRLARPGNVVLLSPGGTSFDAYRDFVARGEHFRHLVQTLESEHV
jgi:UDP-N-acetylmuramoylalanine--D-glutamate ligase